MNPKLLYKFRRANENTIGIIRKKTIWAPTLDKLNDPFDGNVILNENLTEEECASIILKIGEEEGFSKEKIELGIRRYIDENGSFRIGAMLEFHKDLPSTSDPIKNVGVICLSESCDNVLMWTHYCSEHTGICIGFDVSEMFRREPDGCQKMRYQSEYPKATLADLFLTPNQYSMKTIWTKSSDWTYEKEWRYIVEEGNSEGPIPGPIKEIIFGCYSKPEFESTIRDLTQGQGILFKRATLSPTQYKILIQ